MTAIETAVRLMDMTAGALAEADMPADPFQADDILDAAKHLGAELTLFVARTRAHRVANAAAWAAHTQQVRAAFDPEGMPPPPPDPPPDPKPVTPPPPPPPTDHAAPPVTNPTSAPTASGTGVGE